ncbi:interleukin-12 receptor subunit beta-2 isoform X2 [Trachinotus anak]|uniref:interleukin-12 receptor subunit beta-2 isoform X2 n=1 Tax=Trachinotus anak TaxID=443729 RepID=UPI0039F254F2
MSKTWSVFSAVTLLVQVCIGEKSCAIWSSAGSVVQRDSSFKNRTYSCNCDCTKRQCNCPAQDPCGLDIKAGYPPDRPKNISCNYTVINNESGVVICSWNRGRETYLRDSSVLRVRTVPRNHTDGPEFHSVSCKGTDVASVNFTVSTSVQLISVRVQVENALGSAVSSTIDYTLSDIVMPSTPVLGQPKCSSRECIFKVKQSVKTQHLEIQYRSAEQTWTSYPHKGVQMNTVQDWSISSLEPYRLYYFRARSKFSIGLWSQWSSNISSWTEEEAPANELDVWSAVSVSDLKSLRVYWKEANISVSRGKIKHYKVSVTSPDSVLVSVNVSSDARNYTVPICANCEVTVSARNSRGLSPPARITAHHTKAKPSQYVQVSTVNHSVTISWREPETAPPPAVYVVEWYPEGLKLEELRWMRLGRNDDHAVITDIQPFECYEGAVYGLYTDSSVTRTMFTGVTTLESVPEAGPVVQERVEGDTVKVTWIELPRSQRRGCITYYTIYLENDSGHQQPYSVPASERMYVIRDLSPAAYSLWMTASTAVGEGPACQKIKFFIQEKTPLWLLLVCSVTFLIVVLLLCLCQCSAVKQKFRVFFQCLMLDVVPDPANSKWAKECAQEKGKMNLQLQLSNSSVTEEEEPILVDVEELPKQNNGISKSRNVSSQLPPQIGLSPETEPTTQLYPLSTYIKSFSHDSDSSDHTQTSLDTNTTVDYISSHGMGNMEDEDQEEEEEEEEEGEMLGFFPSQNIFIDTLDIGGKLTLDAVKIDFCTDFFQNS